MSLFKKAGKKYEETKRAITDASEATHVCNACESRVSEDYDYCPHCGEAAIEELG